ncbi:hypothetical protein EB796_015626 [Bugula neritina]|uniref:G-patch domain-containing protein n=1 Tax=Bugula neritina TaxID=10212 RepID=A0A7J7JKV0_BUGNE|nr:hypothetical protein EB796_015626 [Bugula neritina]
MSKGMSLLKSMGWSEGSGLGSNKQGIKEPVQVETTINRQGFGFDDGSKSLKKCAHDFFSSYIREGGATSLSLAASLPRGQENPPPGVADLRT